MQRFIDNWTAEAVFPVSAGDLTISVSAGQAAKLVALADGDTYEITAPLLDADGKEIAWEIMNVTGRSGGVLTVERGQNGTTALAFPAGTEVSARLTADAVESLRGGTTGDAVTSFNGRDGEVELLAADVEDALGYLPATPSQGEKADTAVQPGTLATELNGKVDKETGKGLSSNDFTSAEKSKLAGLDGNHFRGTFITLAALQSAVPTGTAGDYADVDGGSDAPVLRYIWDASDIEWVAQAGSADPITAAQTKVLYESNADTNAFTDDEKAKLGGVAAGATANTDTDSLPEAATPTNRWFTEARVRATNLTGLSLVTTTVITAADSLLVAIGKLAGRLALAFDRANHSGTQASTTISDFEEAAQDVIGSSLIAGANVSVNYNDTTGKTTIASTASGGGSAHGVAVSDFAGNDPTGATTSQSQVTSALATKNEFVYLEPGSKFLAPSFTNTLGAKFEGGGAIVKAVTGGLQQLNTYADKGQFIAGREYLYAFHKLLITQLAAPTRAVKVRFAGDSTTKGDDASAPYKIHTLFKEAGIHRGLNPVYGFEAVNAGVSGVNTEQYRTSYLGADIAEAPDLYVVRLGVNDPGWLKSGSAPPADAGQAYPNRRDRDDFLTSLRSLLSTFRASRTLSQTSIVLMMPNTTSDTPNGRDELWYEQIAEGVKQAARDYQCCFLDTYGWLKDSRPSAGLWMDNPYSDGRAIHPLDVMQLWIMDLISAAVFPEGVRTTLARNKLRITGGLEESFLPTVTPANCKFGIGIYRAQESDGWPVDGNVQVVRSGDDSVMQTIWPYKAAQAGQFKVRYGTPGTAGGSISGWSSWYELANAANSSAAVTPDTTTARTLALADAGLYLRSTNAAAVTFTVPTASWVANTEIHIRRAGAANLTLAAASGVTLNAPYGGTLVMGNGMSVTLKLVGTNTWDVIGQTVPV